MLKDFTLEQIQEIAAQSRSWQEILNRLGYKSRGSLTTIKTYFINNNIECSLLKGIVTQVCPICGETFIYQNKGEIVNIVLIVVQLQTILLINFLLLREIGLKVMEMDAIFVGIINV